jgi:2-amino-4-hydroxy-6-hydroxymethyldihydropteridine diphosphokinase
VPVVAGAFIGLGSNLGEPVANLESAVARLAREPGVTVEACSGFYQSAPVGVLDQPWFVNAVLKIATSLQPVELLDRLQQIERDLGRRPTRRWGERVLDLDVLLYDDLELSTDRLTIPHPRLWERLFVLRPLAELAPELRARDGRPIGTVIAQLERDQIVQPLSRRS